MTDKDYIFEDWWTPAQIDIIKNSLRIWTKKPFKTTSGFWIETDEGKLLGKTSNKEQIPPDAVVDNSAWDHEHCELCFEKISDKDGYQHEGYTDGKEWLCLSCYDKYLSPFRDS